MNKKNKIHRGQVALIMVLIMTVVSAIAVSVAGRSTTESRIQQQDVESKEALLTAQSGLEKALTLDANVTGTVDTGTFDVVRTDTGSTGILTDKVLPGEQIEVNLSGLDAGTTAIKVHWKAAVAGEVPAIFVSDIQSTLTKDYAFSGDAADQTRGFAVPVAGGTWSGVVWTYSTTQIPVTPGTSLLLHITVLGKPALLGIRAIGGTNTFPAQTTAFKSVGTVTSTDTAIKYGIEYTESKTNLIPGVFDYALFSLGTIQ